MSVAPPNPTPQPYEPELGQMVFGNPSGAYDLGPVEDYAVRKLIELSEEIALTTGDPFAGDMYGYGQEFKNGVFEMHPYYWGDCTCGFEREDCDWWDKHDHTPQCFSTRYEAEEDRLEAEGVDWDEKHELMTEWAKAQGYEDAPYGMAAYCDCGVDASYAEWRQTHDHDPQCPTVLPNFRCGSTSLRWYKHVGRGMSSDAPVTRDELKAAFKKCFASLEA